MFKGIKGCAKLMITNIQSRKKGKTGIDPAIKLEKTIATG